MECQRHEGTKHNLDVFDDVSKLPRIRLETLNCIDDHEIFTFNVKTLDITLDGKTNHLMKSGGYGHWRKQL